MATSSAPKKLLYSALSISRGHFFPRYSQGTHHSSPVSLNHNFLCYWRGVCSIMLYWTAIYIYIYILFWTARVDCIWWRHAIKLKMPHCEGWGWDILLSLAICHTMSLMWRHCNALRYLRRWNACGLWKRYSIIWVTQIQSTESEIDPWSR